MVDFRLQCRDDVTSFVFRIIECSDVVSSVCRGEKRTPKMGRNIEQIGGISLGWQAGKIFHF